MGRVGRRSLGAVLLLACLVVAASGGASLGAQDPAASIPAGVTMRYGDAVPDERIRALWDSFSPVERESLLERTGIGSLEDLRNMPITGPFQVPPHAPTAPSDALQRVDVIDPSQAPRNLTVQDLVIGVAPGNVEAADGELLLSQNQCTGDRVKASKVHFSQTTWCYDGSVITPTPENYILWAYGTSIEWWNIAGARITQEGISVGIRRTSGGYWQDHLQDKSRAIIEKKTYIDNNPGPEVCVRWYSDIWKKGLGNGNTARPQSFVSDEWRC